MYMCVRFFILRKCIWFVIFSDAPQAIILIVEVISRDD